MDIIKVKSIVQNLANQMIGAGYFPVNTAIDAETGQPIPPSPITIEGVDSALLVDLGEAAKSSPAATEFVYKALIDQIGKIVIESRSYTAELPSLFVDPIDWGGFVEHVQVGLSDVYDDEMWNPDGFINYSETGGPAYAQSIAEQEHAFYKPRVNAKIYKEAKAISVRLSRLQDQLFGSFNGFDQMNRYLSALFTSVENTLQVKAQVFAMATVATAIGKATALGHTYNLRTLYNTETGNNIASAEAFRNNEAAMKWALAFMANTKDNFQTPSIAFNNGNEPVFTPAADTRLILLSRFANDAKFGVRANTYHEELIGIGDFEKVTSWQGIRTGSAMAPAFTWGAISQVNFTADSAEKVGLPEGTTSIQNVVGVLYDKYAMGISLDKKKVTTSYTAVNDTWNSFYHALVNYIVNDNYSICVFTLN